MKKATIRETKNGWIVETEGFIRINGEYVYNSTAILEMLEFLGEHINDRKVAIQEK